jgi:hypothetical protein
MENAIIELLTKLNKLLSDQGTHSKHQFLNKIDRFDQFNGNICCFLNDKETIEELNRRKNSIINSDDELMEQPTRDPELVGSESSNSEPKAFEDFEEGIGLAKSAFRELHGVPLKAPFLSKIVVEITLNNSEFNLEELFGESKFVWIQHRFKNTCDCNTESMDDEQKASDSCSSFNPTLNSRWSLAMVEKTSVNTIWVSGAKILHNSPIFDIQDLESKVVLDYLNEHPESCDVPAKLVQVNSMQDSFKLFEDMVQDEISNMANSLLEVSYSESVMDDLRKIIEQKKLDFFDNTEDVIAAINQVLSCDPV